MTDDSSNASQQPSELARRVLALVRREDYRPVKPRILAKRLKLSGDEATELKRVIKRLIKSGQLIYGANHQVQAVATAGRNEVVGVFRRHAAGYGFVRPQGTKKAAGRSDDIFVPAARTRDAASGDLVRVKTSKRRSAEGEVRWVGEVTAIMRRGSSQFVATYLGLQGTTGWAQIDGTEFAHPIRVGDPTAKGVTKDDKIVIELIRYPTATQTGEGVVVEVLGRLGAPGIDTLTIMREFELPERFPEDVLAAARVEVERFTPEIPEGRTDLTQLTTLTIDPVDARDFDDAISLERIENGHWRLGVHIADVSHFVRVNTPLDREARDRATSVYLTDRVIPMLPELISNHLASLQPHEVRFTMTAFIEYTADGARVATDFCVSAIRSDRRFTYEEVDEYLADRIAGRVRYGAELSRLLDDMHRLAMILRQRRLDRGSIELQLPEIKIELDRQGRVRGARPVARTESHQVIEEFMLAANESVAERLRDEHIACLRRIHESPDPKKMEILTGFVQEMGIVCESMEDRFETKRVLAEVMATPLEPAVNYAVLRAMQKAVYAPDEVGHYALAFRDYCHFTSPIRRYPDLTIHRVMRMLASGQRPPGDLAALVALGEHCSQREQRADAAERELTKLKLLHYFEDKIGQVLDVVVTGVEEFGVFGQGLEIPAEGLISVRSLRDDHYRYDSDTHALTGFLQGNTFRLGDLLRVKVARVDLARRELDFVFVERLSANRPLRHGASERFSDEGTSPRGRRHAAGPPTHGHSNHSRRIESGRGESGSSRPKKTKKKRKRR